MDADLAKVDRQLKHHYRMDRTQATIAEDRSRIIVRDNAKQGTPVNAIMRFIPALFVSK